MNLQYNAKNELFLPKQIQKSRASSNSILKENIKTFMELNEPTERIFNLDERLVRFAGESIFFVRKLAKAYELEYYKNQLIRSSGSASLNYGESQGTITDKDYVFKLSLVVKELKESRNSLRVLNYIKEGEENERNWLLSEVEELIAITSRMMLNKLK
ncbi:four helix bundle protein [Flavobacterium aquaticum]|uniref:Four helix bundle protein n=3 Tax=Flavobacteriaceae TaxID=49546 RepID=A0A327YVW2_9FLAO|nr:four helix bundle protein [Flavobacterium aquaticum]